MRRILKDVLLLWRNYKMHLDMPDKNLGMPWTLRRQLCLEHGLEGVSAPVCTLSCLCV